MPEIEYARYAKINQRLIDDDGVLRLVIDGEWKMRYFNLRSGETDIVLEPK